MPGIISQPDRSVPGAAAGSRASDRLRRSADGVNMPRGNSGTKRRRGGSAFRSSAPRHGPFVLCQAEGFGNSFLARIIHERFCCNRRSTATTNLRRAGSPPHRTTRVRIGSSRLSDFATNRYEYCGLDSVSFRLPSWQSLDGHPVPPAISASGYATPRERPQQHKKKRTRSSIVHAPRAEG